MLAQVVLPAVVDSGSTGALLGRKLSSKNINMTATTGPVTRIWDLSS